MAIPSPSPGEKHCTPKSGSGSQPGRCRQTRDAHFGAQCRMILSSCRARMLKTLQLLAGEALRWFPAGLVAHFRPLPGLRGPCPQCLRCCRMGLCLSLRLLVRQWDGTARVADGSHQLPEERDRAHQYGRQCLEHFTGAVREPTDQQNTTMSSGVRIVCQIPSAASLDHSSNLPGNSARRMKFANARDFTRGFGAVR